MVKSDLLDQLRAAKTAHIQWRTRAQALINGVSLEEEAVPVLHTDCKFGKWYYGQGQALYMLQPFRDIDGVHEKLHLTYMEIFKLLFGEDDRSTLSKLFGSKKQYEAARLEKAKQLLPILINISKEMLALVETLEKQVLNMPDEEVATII